MFINTFYLLFESVNLLSKEFLAILIAFKKESFKFLKELKKEFKRCCQFTIY